MRQHFTNSERLALEVYRVLREGGIVDCDFTDMEALHIDGGYGRRIVFRTNPTSNAEPILMNVCVVLRGEPLGRQSSDPYLFFDWKLDQIVKEFGIRVTTCSRDWLQEEVEIPQDADEISAGLLKAQMEVRRLESLLRLKKLKEEPFF